MRRVGVKYWDNPIIIGERERYWKTVEAYFFPTLTVYWRKGDCWRYSNTVLIRVHELYSSKIGMCLFCASLLISVLKAKISKFNMKPFDDYIVLNII